MTRILFVDDDPFTLETLAKAVQLLGHQAISVSSGEEALVAAAAESPELIFVDRSLADMDGLALVSALKEQPATHHIPILVLSAGPELEAADLAKAAGARAYLNKPIRLQALMDAIEEYSPK